MAKKKNGFSDRFPHFGKILFLSLILSLAITVWSFQKAPTNTQQEAATKILCSVGQIKKCQSTNPGYCDRTNCTYYTSGCNATNPSTCFYNADSSCTAAGIPCILPTPTPTSISCYSAGGTCTTYSSNSTGGGYINCPAGTALSNIYSCAVGSYCCMPTLTPTPIPSCASQGGTCIPPSNTSSIICPTGTQIIREAICTGTTGTYCCK